MMVEPNPSVNSVMDADPYEDDGEPWDCDRGFPDEPDEDDDEEE
jgi:hypothetical protein